MYRMQLIRMVPVWTNEPLPFKLKLKPQVIQPKPMSLFAWLLRGYHDEYFALPDVMPGES